jgi:hypothetical protein
MSSARFSVLMFLGRVIFLVLSEKAKLSEYILFFIFKLLNKNLSNKQNKLYNKIVVFYFHLFILSKKKMISHLFIDI